ncbi:S41 family peptidase [Gelidibacter sp.]|uniref:S41 family peptidase n=1 Tax=Gelidibacter sp. TaxID=2018083 RepID=UPI002CF6D00B|nr:S41 family peptidase [Gelidibacter sp.]HUH26820.1 S41 family peptidase [Gelidibacter sp.]
MKVLKVALFALIIFSLNTSCFKDKDDEPTPPAIVKNEINDFVWTAMNIFYLYKSEIPNLADNRFTSEEAYINYINGYSEPEEFFESLIYQREVVDRFSFITPDYIALEQQFQGVFKSNGLESNYYLEPGSNTKVFGVVRLVLNDSEGSAAGIKRGQIFNSIDGVQMTVDNFNALLNQDTYTLNFATYNSNGTATTDDDFLEPTSETVKLTKKPYNENPVHTSKVLDINGAKIGYLMYTSFTGNYDKQLNEAFGEFKSAGVKHLVLDLRYNGGGSVNTAALLASMITGQFNGKVFSKLVWNENLQSENTSYNFRNTAAGGVGAINSLNLEKVYVLTTSRTASASELIINGLSPYIDVVQIGGRTTGKSQASVTLYDSENFSRENANPNHTYAIQPLVAVSVNKDDARVPPNGFLSAMTHFQMREAVNNLGVLGEPTEPFFAKAIADITGSARPFLSIDNNLIPLTDHVDKKLLDNEMYIDVLDHLPAFQNLR